MRLRTPAFASLLAFLASASACGELKRADESVDAGDGDGGAPQTEGGASSDGGADAPPDDDAGPPPRDSECNDPWTATTKSQPECAARRVQIVDPDLAIDASGVSIARTPAGRVGISYNVEIDGQSGEHHFVHFVPSAPGFSPTVVKRAKGPYDHAGYLSRVAASAPDVLHVLAHDVDDVTFSGEVVVVRSIAGAALTSPEQVIGGVKRPSEIGFAVDSSGASYATVRMAGPAGDAGATARLAARRKTAGGAWTALPDITTALTPSDAPATGSAKLVTDASGQLHLLYHHCETLSHSSPRYHTLDGATWSYRKTVDNAVPDGLSGYGAQLGVFGTRKWAAYYFRKALQGAPEKADLRLATWEGNSDTPTISVLAQSIPAPNAQYPDYRVAMAVDRFGLVHLAILTPSPANPRTGALEYMRQTRTDTGAVVWLTDVVDGDVVSETSSAWVDLVVDDASRPHIAYVSGKDLKVRYATRYDR
jgi:hypothetical protein